MQEGRTAEECFEEPRVTNQNPGKLMEVPDAPRYVKQMTMRVERHIVL